jgi:hypothetical protein
MLERKITIGLITSTEYLKKIRSYWNPTLLESNTARLITGWCISHYDKYQKAPGKELETIFFQKAARLDKEVAEEIEQDILPDLSDEFTQNDIDLDYLFTETIEYLKTRQLLQLGQQITEILEHGIGDSVQRLKEVEELRENFKPISVNSGEGIDLSNEKVLRNIRRAFSEASDPVIVFPKQLGEFWNTQFVPGGLIGILAPEKRGKTWMLLEMAFRATRMKKKVAFFQAGDMNESEQLKRIAIHLCQRSDKEKYCQEHYQSTRDCILNQRNDCNKSERECDFGPLEDMEVEEIKKLTLNELVEYYKTNDDYKPCYNCKDYNNKKLGAPWLKKIAKVEPIDYRDAQQAVEKYFIKCKRSFKLSTHPNGTLSVNDIISILDKWELDEGFIPDVVIVDYADLLVSSIKSEFRHQQNQIWKELRKLSQTVRGNVLPLVISPTQADADSYKKYRLELSNFSEDKRKYAHVTAMYGLNQDPSGREKDLGLMRINEIIGREGDFSIKNEVTVCQDIRQGRPAIESYFQ